MIEFKAENKPRIALSLDGAVELTFTAPKTVLRALDGLTDKPLTVTVKEFRQKRSLSQNSYLWVLLDKLGAKLNRSREELYKMYVKGYGVVELLPIKTEAVAEFNRRWGKQGLGWFTEDLGESKLNGYTRLAAYYGSSTYNTQEMTRLIDAVVYDCHEQGIDTMTLTDIMLLMNDND